MKSNITPDDWLTCGGKNMCMCAEIGESCEKCGTPKTGRSGSETGYVFTGRKTQKAILDPCCGSRMFWFNKNNQGVLFGDKRQEEHVLCDGRTLTIEPDVQMDFRNLPFENGKFRLVVFDPPHLCNAGKESWVALKYGVLGQDWKSDLTKGFSECFRVLKNEGILIFKWNEIQIKTSEVVSLSGKQPLFGHISGKRADTHWICFMNT